MALLLCHCDAFGTIFHRFQKPVKVNLVLCFQGLPIVSEMTAL
jgi:hypothetical protein